MGKRQKEEKLEIFIPNGPRLGNKVIEAEHVAKAFGDKVLFDDLEFKLPPAGIVGVIGPNGAGKTTLFRLIMGVEQPDKGTFEVGPTVKIAYLVMVRIAIIRFFVLGRVAELMLDDQTSIYKQNDGIVKRCTADAEVLLVGHQ